MKYKTKVRAGEAADDLLAKAGTNGKLRVGTG
jgi:hypothetical protein